jgi:hypothetical protein
MSFMLQGQALRAGPHCVRRVVAALELLERQIMKKLHLAIATKNIEATVIDYSQRFGCEPCVIVPEQYALWRTESLNVSVRQDSSCKSGSLRHMGWEDAKAVTFSEQKDVNGITWETFTAEQQAEEIEEVWPGTDYVPDKV